MNWAHWHNREYKKLSEKLAFIPLQQSSQIICVFTVNKRCNKHLSNCVKSLACKAMCLDWGVRIIRSDWLLQIQICLWYVVYEYC